MTDRGGFALGDGGQDVDRHAVCLRHVAANEINAALHEAGQERDVTCQAIQLGDNQGRLLQPAQSECLLQLVTIRALAGLDFFELADKLLAAAVQILGDGLSLSLKAEARDALLGG